jgi:hypothetical protein
MFAMLWESPQESDSRAIGITLRNQAGQPRAAETFRASEKTLANVAVSNPVKLAEFTTRKWCKSALVGRWVGLEKALLLPSENAQELDRIATKICALAEAALKSGRSDYLLSELGIALGEDLAKVKTITQGSLLEFIKQRLGDRFGIVSRGIHNNVYTLAPLRETYTIEEQATSSASTAEPATGAAGQWPRYNYRFWAAFAVGLSNDVRHLKLTDFTFKDVSSNEEVPTGTVEIPVEYIPPESISDRDTHISANIEKWLAANRLRKEQFLASPPRSFGTQQDGHPVAVRAGISVLELVIDALDRRQLQSMSISLDAVAALLKRRV